MCDRLPIVLVAGTIGVEVGVEPIDPLRMRARRLQPERDAIVGEGDPHLGQGDLRFEPASALSSGADGLDAIRSIVRDAPRHLVPGGWLLLEHGWDQGEAVRALLAAADFIEVETARDLEARDRVTLGRRPT